MKDRILKKQNKKANAFILLLFMGLWMGYSKTFAADSAAKQEQEGAAPERFSKDLSHLLRGSKNTHNQQRQMQRPYSALAQPMRRCSSDGSPDSLDYSQSTRSTPAGELGKDTPFTGTQEQFKKKERIGQGCY